MKETKARVDDTKLFSTYQALQTFFSLQFVMLVLHKIAKRVTHFLVMSRVPSIEPQCFGGSKNNTRLTMDLEDVVDFFIGPVA